jgi:hypothetical protein
MSAYEGREEAGIAVVKVWIAAAGAFVLLAAVGAAFARESERVFYLSVHPRQCLIDSAKPTTTVLVVPCSNPTHNFEVYAIGHGGWGHRTLPAGPRSFAIARSVCLSTFQRLTGHPLRLPYGWSASWPGAGAETARYGDKIICSLRAWPRLAPLGSGWHVH